MAKERAEVERSGQTDMRHCMRCGWLDFQSRIPLVLVEVPKDERIEVEVTLVTETRVGLASRETRRVPGIYAAEYRCRDVAACSDRVAEQRVEELANQAPPDPVVVATPPPALPRPDPMAAWIPADGDQA